MSVGVGGRPYCLEGIASRKFSCACSEIVDRVVDIAAPLALNSWSEVGLGPWHRPSVRVATTLVLDKASRNWGQAVFPGYLVQAPRVVSHVLSLGAQQSSGLLPAPLDIIGHRAHDLR
jgi:hypothetical protein